MTKGVNKLTKTNNKINIVYKNLNKTDGFLDKYLIHIQKYIEYLQNIEYIQQFYNKN